MRLPRRVRGFTPTAAPTPAPAPAPAAVISTAADTPPEDATAADYTHSAPELQRADSCDGGDDAARYSLDLLQAFPAVCHKAKCGVQTCLVVAAFIQERAAMETAYAKALQRVAQSAHGDDWAPQLTRSWSVVQETLEKVAAERAAVAAKMQLSTVAAVKAFASQQELQVQRLITEGRKVRNAQQHMLSSLHKAKEKYDRKCAEAAEVTGSLRLKADAADTGSVSAPASSSSPSLSVLDSGSSDDSAREIAEKFTAGAGQLLTKMWDSTSSLGKSSVERQRSKVESCLEDVIAAEKSYLQTVDFMNAQRLIYEREIKENLHAFQLTEEQRVEYLKDLLLRQQEAAAKTYQHSVALVETLKESVVSINEIADIEDAFRTLVELEVESGTDDFDLANNGFSKRMLHIQALSDRGHHMVKVVSSTITELIAAEDAVMQSLQRQLRIHEHGTVSTSSSDLFGSSALASFHAGSYVADEGTSMKAGLQVARDQVHLLMNVHQEFRSLLAEPVSLSLSTMRQQYENARNATQDNFAKSHAALSSECGAHQKVQQKLEARTRDFIAIFASVNDAAAAKLSPSSMVAEQAATLLQRYSGMVSDRRVEAKLRHLCDEMRELQSRVAESNASLKEKIDTYVQDIEVFVSVYMKNEKYRLQIKKSSLLAFAKAYEHMLAGALSVTLKATAIMERIDPSSDITEFVDCHRKPRERSKRVVPAYHNNDVLKDALSDYYRSRVGSPCSGSPEDRKQRRSPKASDYTDSPMKTKKRELSLDLDVIAATSTEQTAACESDDLGSPVAAVAVAATGGDGDGAAAPAPIDASDCENDTQPLAMSDFQKKFQLDSPEQVVESYSCALYLSNFPYHGRLYLTRDHICFTGWRDTIYVTSYLEITHIEKKNTALIVPNAIELTVNGERVFFTSFVFRDECFQCLQQLQAIKKGTVALMSGNTGEQSGNSEAVASAATAPESNGIEATGGKKSPPHLPSEAPKSAVLSPVETVQLVHESAPASSVAAPPLPVAVARRIPERDAVLDEYEVVVDEVAPFSVDFASSVLWVESSAFFLQFLREGGETGVSVAEWIKAPVTFTLVSTPEVFDGSRRVCFVHNKKYMVGPSTIPTTQEQRFALDPGVRLIVSSSSTVTDVPYCDYFRAENRWVFSATPTDGECRVQVGIRVAWIKSTWLKKQIESTAVTEARENAKAWLTAALLTSAGTPRVAIGAATAGESVSSSPRRLQSPPASTIDVNSLKFALQVASLCCLLMFIYTMHRIVAALEHMEVLTRDSLRQQRQQQELLKEVMQAFLERERNPR
ncbi:hypothetical protein PybrP1_010655 [[Pythium] brassicae (nom. inval.)]|nr:hypothetical protein PybrP1_010655 [[Pythium] brassicae (nom. inval.)]